MSQQASVQSRGLEIRSPPSRPDARPRQPGSGAADRSMSQQANDSRAASDDNTHVRSRGLEIRSPPSRPDARPRPPGCGAADRSNHATPHKKFDYRDVRAQKQAQLKHKARTKGTQPGKQAAHRLGDTVLHCLFESCEKNEERDVQEGLKEMANAKNPVRMTLAFTNQSVQTRIESRMGKVYHGKLEKLDAFHYDDTKGETVYVSAAEQKRFVMNAVNQCKKAGFVKGPTALPVLKKWCEAAQIDKRCLNGIKTFESTRAMVEAWQKDQAKAVRNGAGEREAKDVIATFSVGRDEPGAVRTYLSKLPDYHQEVRNANSTLDRDFSHVLPGSDAAERIRAGLERKGIRLGKDYEIGHIQPKGQGGEDCVANFFIQRTDDNTRLASLPASAGELAAAGRLDKALDALEAADKLITSQQLTEKQQAGCDEFSRPCFDVNVRVHVMVPQGQGHWPKDAGWVRVCDLQAGDYVEVFRSSAGGEARQPPILAQVLRVTCSAVDDEILMCQVGGLWLTPGHPVLLGNRWMRPSELAPPTSRWQDAVYNLVLAPQAPILVSGYADGSDPSCASTLGHATPGIAGEADDGWLQAASQQGGVVDWLLSFQTFRVNLTYRGSQADVDAAEANAARYPYALVDIDLTSASGPLAERMARKRMIQVRRLEGVMRCELVDDPKAASRSVRVFLVASSKKALERATLRMDTNQAAADMQKFRDALPVASRKSQVVLTARQNLVTVLVAETGSGKTTQIPQYLAEVGGFTNSSSPLIGCTQPRVVAARTVAERVADEYGVAVGAEIGYTVRHDNKTGPKTKIRYVTDGVLQRELLCDPLLRKYGVICVDEAHERSVTTDIILALLKRAVRLRAQAVSKAKSTASESEEVIELRVIVMSATLDAKEFQEFFESRSPSPSDASLPLIEMCPLLEIPGRSFPVQVRYSQEGSDADVVERAVSKVFEIHESTNETGDILVFLPGQYEIMRAVDMVRKVQDQLGERSKGAAAAALKGKLVPAASQITLKPLPLYARLSKEAQDRAVRRPADKGTRKVIFSTNVAETSVTIVDIAFVVDPGFVKRSGFDAVLGFPTLSLDSISQASANQRKGRAGRNRGGVCHRLYPETKYDAMLPMTPPEILNCDLASSVLYLASLGLKSSSFDFINAPPEDLLQAARTQLITLGALESAAGEVATPLGLRMASLPMEPRLARAVCAADELGCVDSVLCIAAMLSSPSGVFLEGGPPFRVPTAKSGTAAVRRKRDDRAAELVETYATDGLGDHVALHRIFQAYLEQYFRAPVLERGNNTPTRKARERAKQQAAAANKSWCKDRHLDSYALDGVWEAFVHLVEQVDASDVYVAAKEGKGPFGVARDHLNLRHHPYWTCSKCSGQNDVERAACQTCKSERFSTGKRQVDRAEMSGAGDRRADRSFRRVRTALTQGFFLNAARLANAEKNSYVMLNGGHEVRLDATSLLHAGNGATSKPYILFNNAVATSSNNRKIYNCMVLDIDMLLDCSPGVYKQQPEGCVVPASSEAALVEIPREFFRDVVNGGHLARAKAIDGICRIDLLPTRNALLVIAKNGVALAEAKSQLHAGKQEMIDRISRIGTIPTRLVGRLLGAKHRKRRELEETFSCTLNVHIKHGTRAINSEFEVMGLQSNVDALFERVTTEIAKWKLQTPDHDVPSALLVNRVVWIPTAYVARLIGKKGTTISQLKLQWQVQIEVEKKAVSLETRVTVSGLAQGVVGAIGSIQGLVGCRHE